MVHLDGAVQQTRVPALNHVRLESTLDDVEGEARGPRGDAGEPAYGHGRDDPARQKVAQVFVDEDVQAEGRDVPDDHGAESAVEAHDAVVSVDPAGARPRPGEVLHARLGTIYNTSRGLYLLVFTFTQFRLQCLTCAVVENDDTQNHPCH